MLLVRQMRYCFNISVVKDVITESCPLFALNIVWRCFKHTTSSLVDGHLGPLFRATITPHTIKYYAFIYCGILEKYTDGGEEMNNKKECVDSRTKCNREEERGEKFERVDVLMYLPGSVVE